MPRIRLTHHARQAMARRGVDLDDVADAIRDPQLSTRRADGQHLYSRGPITVVTVDDGTHMVILTVLLFDADRWDDQTAAHRIAAAR